MQMFDASVSGSAQSNLGLSSPATSGQEFPQPSIFVGKLKSYQVKVSVYFRVIFYIYISKVSIKCF